MSNTCLYVLLGFILASSGYLAYMNISKHFQISATIRYWLFFGQHIFLAAFLYWNNKFQQRDDMGHKLKALLIFSGINFFFFTGYEIFSLTHFNDQAQFFGEPDPLIKDFANASYLHLYYQYNIYNGVFFIFCAIMMIFYIIHQRNQERDYNEVIEGLEEEQYEAEGSEDPCPICLTNFQKDQTCIKLLCSHIFHWPCLKKWLQTNMTCPMCRDNIRDRILQRNRQNRQQDF